MQVCRWGTYQSALACLQEGSKAAASPVLTMTLSMRHPSEYRFAQLPSFARHHQLCRRRCRLTTCVSTANHNDIVVFHIHRSSGCAFL